MNALTVCPECGSSELRETERKLGDATVVRPIVCDACHWTSDLRLGRPPADRGKNVTLRRLLNDANKDDDPSDERQPPGDTLL